MKIWRKEIVNNLFNLAFGDWDESKQRINDKARTNNDDRNKVLATVGATVFDFMKYHPGATIFDGQYSIQNQTLSNWNPGQPPGD